MKWELINSISWESRHASPAGRAFVLVVIVATIVVLAWGQKTTTSTVSLAEARRAIQAGNVEWGKARVAIDKDTFEKMLGPDLYIQLYDRKLTRQEFIDMISSLTPGVKLTRFDATVLTLEPRGSDWVATILEKVEGERRDADGKTQKLYVLSITRDGWRKLNDNKWIILFSEQLGLEKWMDVPPPIPNW